MYITILLMLFSFSLNANEQSPFTSQCWNAHQIVQNHLVNPPWLIIKEAQKDYLESLWNQHSGLGLRQSLLEVTNAAFRRWAKETSDNYEQNAAEHSNY